MPSTTHRLDRPDGPELLVRHWPPSGEPWAAVLLVHGLGEHSGRYEHVGQRLAEAGLDVHAYDQRGFGASGGQPAFVRSFAELHDDLAERLSVVRERSAGRPVVLYGHSLGGLIALGYVLTDRPSPDLLVLSAPAVDSAIPGWKQGLARVLGRVAPRVAIDNGLRGDQLSHDPTVGERYFADPLNRHRTTTGLGAAALAEQARIRRALPGLDLPTYVLHGADDSIVPARFSEPLAALAGVTRRVHPGLRHETHNEPEWQAVVDEVVAWLRDRVDAASGARMDGQSKIASGERTTR